MSEATKYHTVLYQSSSAIFAVREGFSPRSGMTFYSRESVVMRHDDVRGCYNCCMISPGKNSF